VLVVAGENHPANFSVNEKDEASPLNCFRRDPLDAFIPRIAGIEGFLFSASIPLWSLNRKNRSAFLFAGQN